MSKRISLLHCDCPFIWSLKFASLSRRMDESVVQEKSLVAGGEPDIDCHISTLQNEENEQIRLQKSIDANRMKISSRSVVWQSSVHSPSVFTQMRQKTSFIFQENDFIWSFRQFSIVMISKYPGRIPPLAVHGSWTVVYVKVNGSIRQTYDWKRGVFYPFGIDSITVASCRAVYGPIQL